MDLQKLLSGTFTVKGRVKALKKDSGSKAMRFAVGSTERNLIREFGIDPYSSLPCYSPFLLYHIEVNSGICSLFNVRRVLCVSRLYPEGIPSKKIRKLLYRSNGKVELPCIKTREDISKLKISPRLKKEISQICEPQFRGPVFYDLLRYFAYSFLREFSDDQLQLLYDQILIKPWLMCFRESFTRLTRSIALKKKKKVTDSALVGRDQVQYALTRWKYYVKPDGISYSRSCPIWNSVTLEYFCRDHGLDLKDSIPDMQSCLLKFAKCERDVALKKIRVFDPAELKLDPKMLEFFSNSGILVPVGNSLMYPSDLADEKTLTECITFLLSSGSTIRFTDIPCGQDDAIDLFITRHIKDAIEWGIIFPYASNSLYFISKMEKGFEVERAKPKRGRKRKVVETDLDWKKVKGGTTNVFYLDQLEEVDTGSFQFKTLFVFNCQDMSISDWSRCLRFVSRCKKIPDVIRMAGDSNCWCSGSQPSFRSLSQAPFLDRDDVPKDKIKFDISNLFFNTKMTKKWDVYQNEPLFSDFLSSWLKTQNIKWDSKVILFTNESMMQRIASATCEKSFRGWSLSTLYLESPVLVESLGLYGVIVKAQIKTATMIWRELEDHNTPIYPMLSSYRLRVEDFYTKNAFIINTEEYSCINPLFQLVRNVQSMPFDHVIMLIDSTSSRQDIIKATRLVKTNFLVYYQKDFDVESVLKMHTHEPDPRLAAVLTPMLSKR
jgi:hypothetical protein